MQTKLFCTYYAIRISLILCLLLSLGIGSAWGTSYISYLDNTQDASTTISTSNVSGGTVGRIGWTGIGCSYSSSRVNILKDGSITFFAASGYKINKIVITSGSSSDYYGTWTSSPSVTPSSLDGVTTFNGFNASSVTITTSTAFRCTSSSHIKIYYTTASCSSEVTVTKGAQTNGTYSLSGTTVCADLPGGTITIASISPSDCYEFDEIVATNGTPDNTNKKVTSITAATTITVKFRKKIVNTYVDEIHGNDNLEECDTHDAPVLDDEDYATSGTCAQQHWHFVGWTTATYKASPEGHITAPGTSMTANGTTYYAVWSKGNISAFDGSTEGIYKIYTTVSGTNYYATNTIKSGVLTTTTSAASAQEYTFTKSGDYWTISYTSGVNTYYLTAPSTNDVALSSFSTTSCNWKIVTGTSGSWRLWSRSPNSSGTNTFAYRALMYNSGVGFKNYTPASYYDCEIMSAEYLDYRCICCEDLGSINGSVNMTSSTDGTVTVSGWSDVSNASSYTVKLYKYNSGTDSWALANNSSTTGGTSGSAATRTSIATDSKSVTYSGLEYGETYKFTVQAIGDGSSYCDGTETAVTSINSNALTDNKFVNKYSIYIDDGTNANYAHNYITSISSHAGSVDITLDANTDYYQYQLSLGGVVWWGNTGKMTSANCSSWTFTAGAANCKLQTTIGGAYSFTLAAGTPAISVAYPSASQESGYKIYFDNSVLEWANIYYRIGNDKTGDQVHNQNTALTSVTGTDNFYYVETPAYDNVAAWHIADNYGWGGTNSVYRTVTNNEQTSIAITNSITFQQYVVTEDITIVPTTTHSTGTSSGVNDNCEFYSINTPTVGMLTHTATITTPSNGTINIAYTDVSGTSHPTNTSSVEDLAHRCVLTITATPDDGYSLSTLTVDEASISSGDEFILADDATIAATFSAKNYTVTLDNNDATSGSQQTVSATYDAAMPLKTTADGTPNVAALERTGYTFTGWWDATSGGKQYYSYSGNPAVIASANNWDKASNTTLKAQWSINSYTLTWSWGGGSTSATSGDDYTAAGLVVYTNPIVYPDDNTMSRNGYTFDGWSNDATTMPAEDLAITAQWTAKEYTVTLDNKSATTAGTESITATFDAALPDITPPTKNGYRFDGYFTAASGGTKYYDADGKGVKNWAKWEANPKLHAHWVAQLTFSVNGEIADELTRDDNTGLPTSASVPTACGDCWAFAGWSTNYAEDGIPAYAGGATHEFGEPTTLYAVYGQAEYKLIYDLSDLEANEYYVLTMLNDDEDEYAMSNTTTETYYATSVDITGDLKENADGWFLYNPVASIIWKFTGNSSSGRLYNETASIYLDLSDNLATILQSNTSDYLNFTKFSNSLFNIASTTQTDYFLYMYAGNKWSVDYDHEGYSSCYIYKRLNAVYTTVPGCETYSITWVVGDDDEYDSGSPTSETNTCAGIETLPADPDDDALDCATKFIGWSESELVGVGHDAPADLFTATGEAPTIDEDKTFYAVFASVDEDSEIPIDHTASITHTNFTEITDSYTTTVTHTYGVDSINTTGSLKIQAYGVYQNAEGIQMNSGKGTYIKNLSAFPGPIKKIEMTWTASGKNSPTIYVAKDAEASTSSTSLGKMSNDVTSHSIDVSVASGYNYFYFDGTTITGACYMSELKITYVDTTFDYKDYTTACCDYTVTLSDGSPSNGTVTFDPVGPMETCTAAKEVAMTIAPAPGYYLSGWTSSGVTPSSISPAVITNTANEQTTTITFAQNTTEGTYTAGATFAAKALEGWTWKYKKDADAANDAVEPYEIPDVVEIYKDQYARFIITGYAPVDVIAAKQGYVYSAGGSEPTYSTDYLTYVSKNGSEPYRYFQLKGKAPVEATTITFKAVGDASITKTVTIRVKALPLVHFVDNVHNEAFADVVATVETGVITLTKQTPTHADFDGDGTNTCEETHLHLVGWIDGDWEPYAKYMSGTGSQPTDAEIIGATGYFLAPDTDIDLVAKDGKTYYAVWAKIE